MNFIAWNHDSQNIFIAVQQWCCTCLTFSVLSLPLCLTYEVKFSVLSISFMISHKRSLKKHLMSHLCMSEIHQDWMVIFTTIIALSTAKACCYICVHLCSFIYLFHYFPLLFHYSITLLFCEWLLLHMHGSTCQMRCYLVSLMTKSSIPYTLVNQLNVFWVCKF